MSDKKPKPPNSVPEEDLSLHENFAPIIAENGLIRQPVKPPTSDTITVSDTVQDLVELRQAEKKAKTLPPQPFPQELTEQVPPEHSFAISGEAKPQVDLSQGEEKVSAPEPKTETKTKRRKHTFLKRLRQARPKKQSAKKAVPSLETVPQVVPPEGLKPVALPEELKPVAPVVPVAPPEQLQPVAPVVPPPQKPPKPQQPKPSRRRWLWVLGIICFLFLGGISSWVPVGRIPLLRNLAYAMGFTPDDTARISFLRALLTWTDKTIGLPGNWSDDPSRISLFAGRSRTGAGKNAGDENDAAGLNVRMDRDSGQTSLINIGALHKLQREKGRALDSVRGAVMPGPGQAEAQADPAQLRDDRVVVRTESNRVQSDVYFGTDADAVGRAAQDGYDSSKTLAKVKNPHIADGKPIDWLLNTTQRLMQTNNPLGGKNRQLEGTRVSWGDSMESLGDKKDRKDLYRAWITSRMAKYTSNLMLKKSLADVGFLGAELPTMASMTLGGGMQIDGSSFQEDQEGWKEYLEFERKCKETLNKMFDDNDGEINNTLKNFQKLYDDKNPSLVYPANCYEMRQASAGAKSNFVSQMETVRDSCKKIRAGYESLESDCMMVISKGMDCDNEEISKGSYGELWEKGKKECNDAFDAAFLSWQGGDENKTREQFEQTVWPNMGKGIASNAGSVKQKLKQHGGQFDTWIRATCDEDGKCEPTDPKQVEQVKDTIGENIFKVK